jgi:hypothetical protein
LMKSQVRSRHCRRPDSSGSLQSRGRGARTARVMVKTGLFRNNGCSQSCGGGRWPAMTVNRQRIEELKDKKQSDVSSRNYKQELPGCNLQLAEQREGANLSPSRQPPHFFCRFCSELASFSLSFHHHHHSQTETHNFQVQILLITLLSTASPPH